MASLNLSGNNNNYYRIEAGDKEGTWSLTLPSQNDTLATLADVFQLGSPWKFKGTANVTITAPTDVVAGDAYINDTQGFPDSSWLGLAADKEIPVDALIVFDEEGKWHELSSSEIDPVFQASVAYTINQGDLANWNMAFGWGNHASEGYLTKRTADILGYGDYNNSTWADPATQAKISNWDMAFAWGNHASMKYLTQQSAIAFGYGDYNNSIWADEGTKNKIPLWDAAHGWGNHNDKGYITEVKALNDIGDVSVPLAQTDEVLTAVRDEEGNLEWQSKTVNVIVEGELLFKGAIDATAENPREDPSAGHIYVHTGGEANPNTEYDLLSAWAPVEKAKYGAKLAYGDDDKWHNIGNAGVGTDLDSFKVINSDEAVKGGELSYNKDTGLFTYFRTDAYTEAKTLELLGAKANVIDVYDKTETYNKTEINQLFIDIQEVIDGKADIGDSYTKLEADEILQGVRQNDVVFLNSNTVNEKGITVKEGWNGVTAGPVKIEGPTFIESGSEWTIVGGATGGDIMTSIFDVKGSPMYGELQAVKKEASKVAALEEEVQELKGMVKQLIKGIK